MVSALIAVKKKQSEGMFVVGGVLQTAVSEMLNELPKSPMLNGKQFNSAKRSGRRMFGNGALMAVFAQIVVERLLIRNTRLVKSAERESEW
jgi:hypothetical protein